MLSGCFAGIGVSTTHLIDNYFDQILNDNRTNSDRKILRNELQIKFKEIYKENRSLDSIVEYNFNTGGGCKFGIHIVCKYQNEMRA